MTITGKRVRPGRLAAGAAAVAGVFLMVAGALLSERYTTETVLFHVPGQATTRDIGRRLAEKGILRSAAVFRLAVRLAGAERRLRAGLYEIPAGSSARLVVRQLLAGQTAVLTITIPEGSAAWNIAAILERRQLCPAEDFLELVAAEGLEGYLYPDTYQVPSDFSAAGIARLFTANFERRWRPEWDRRLQALGMDRHEAVTLASIIEREAGVAAEKPVISSVFHNRLRRGMPLQACPTVLYALGSWRARLTRSQLRTPSPYNTYLHRGLPPGPICSPGTRALAAALYPARTDYLFFVANGDGSHTFSRTLAEHNRAAARARRQRQAATAAEEDHDDEHGTDPGNGRD